MQRIMRPSDDRRGLVCMGLGCLAAEPPSTRVQLIPEHSGVAFPHSPSIAFPGFTQIDVVARGAFCSVVVPMGLGPVSAVAQGAPPPVLQPAFIHEQPAAPALVLTLANL